MRSRNLYFHTLTSFTLLLNILLSWPSTNISYFKQPMERSLASVQYHFVITIKSWKAWFLLLLSHNYNAMTFNTTLFQMRLVLWFTHFTQKQATQIKSYLENREVFVGKIFCCHSLSFTVCRDGQSVWWYFGWVATIVLFSQV